MQFSSHKPYQSTRLKRTFYRFTWYSLAILCGIGVGLSSIESLSQLATFCSQAFIRLFRCVSMPVIALSVIVALMRYGGNRSTHAIWKRTFAYTLFTTLLAVTVSAVLYGVIAPQRVSVPHAVEGVQTITANGYLDHVLQMIPDNILKTFLENQVLAVLLLSLAIGTAIHLIPNEDARTSVQNLFEGLHHILFTIIQWIVAVLPIGLFGFIGVGIREINASTSLQGMGAYFLVILLANVLQGVVVLPLFLLWKRQNPITIFKNMLPALSVAFFTKSSVGTLPVTLNRVETKLGVDAQVSRFVLPLCTTINMNGCGAFIFTTVLYVMHNHGITITVGTMVPWIFIATLAAIGNAGVPMGCFFLSASLLSSIHIPLELMGLILPIYSLIDMLETALNVWSDSCVAVAVNQDMRVKNAAPAVDPSSRN